jgi:hypothetical protein
MYTCFVYDTEIDLSKRVIVACIVRVIRETITPSSLVNFLLFVFHFHFIFSKNLI